MIRNKRTLPLLAAVLLVGSLGLTGCRREDSKTPTPEPRKTIQVVLPMVGDGQSPLPTPGTNQSPQQP